MNHEAICKCQQAANSIDGILVERFDNMSSQSLMFIADSLMTHPEETLESFKRHWPHDTAAMLAMHFYRELIRRAEIKAMDDSPNTKGES